MKTNFKIAAITALLWAGIQLVQAQSIQDLIMMNQLKHAKSLLLQQCLSGNNANDWYQLATLYSRTGQKDSAAYAIGKIQLPETKPGIGLLVPLYTEMLNGNAKNALALGNKAQKQIMATKSPSVITEYAKLRYNSGDTAGWYPLLTSVQDLQKQKPDPFIVAGDIYADLATKYPNNKSLWGLAAGRYEQALFYDPKNLYALNALGSIASDVRNYGEAFTKYQKLMALDSNYIPALKGFGDLNYTLGKYDIASNLYSRYMQLAEVNESDYPRYINILYFNKEYAKAKDLIDKQLIKNPLNPVLLRLKGYTSYELGDYSNGAQAMTQFFDIRGKGGDTSRIIPLDYEYAGKLYQKTNADSAAVSCLLKTIQLDDTKAGLYEDIAKIYDKQKNYREAINNYMKLIESRGGKSSASINFNLGRSYQLLASIDTLQKNAYLRSADTLFANVSKLSPNSQLGYIFRARVLSALDPETTEGLAFNDYSKALEIIKGKNDPVKYKNELAECCRYLGYFYYLKWDAAVKNKLTDEAAGYKQSSIGFWNEVLGYEPNDKSAMDALSQLNKK